MTLLWLRYRTGWDHSQYVKSIKLVQLFYFAISKVLNFNPRFQWMLQVIYRFEILHIFSSSLQSDILHDIVFFHVWKTLHSYMFWQIRIRCLWSSPFQHNNISWKEYKMCQATCHSWANIDQDLLHHMASLSHNAFMFWTSNSTICTQTKTYLNDFDLNSMCFVLQTTNTTNNEFGKNSSNIEWHLQKVSIVYWVPFVAQLKDISTSW